MAVERMVDVVNFFIVIISALVLLFLKVFIARLKRLTL